MWFLIKSINYMGNVVLPRHSEKASRTSDAIRHLKRPTTMTDLKVFFGLCHIFKRVVSDFSSVSAHFNKKIQKYQSARIGHLTQEETATMKYLQNKLNLSQTLASSGHDGAYTFVTDARNLQAGRTLLQEQENKTTRPNGYWSRALRDTKCAYDTTHHECHVVVWVKLSLQGYFMGKILPSVPFLTPCSRFWTCQMPLACWHAGGSVCLSSASTQFIELVCRSKLGASYHYYRTGGKDYAEFNSGTSAAANNFSNNKNESNNTLLDTVCQICQRKER